VDPADERDEASARRDDRALRRLRCVERDIIETAGLVVVGSNGDRIGRGDAYDVDLGGGRSVKVVVVVGSNGYIVSAFPLSARTESLLEKDR